MRISPIYFMGNFSDEEIAEHECSDRLWFSKGEFEFRITQSEPGTIALVQLTNSVEQTAIGSVYGIHTNEEEPDTIYVPSWIYKQLEIDESVQISRIQPALCTGLTIQPHVSDHLMLSDPVITLRNAFEKYSCLTPGLEIPLWIGYTFPVTIVTLQPSNQSPLCITNCEMELDLLPPLDSPAQDAYESKSEKKEEEKEENEIVESERPERQEKPERPEGILLGGEIKYKTTRELMAEAAMKRLCVTQKT